MQDIERDEYALLEQRHRQSQAATTATFLLMPLGVFLSVTILLLGLFLLNSGAGQQQRTEEAMRASEAKYRQLVEQASDGIFVLDVAGRFIFQNPRACELLGYGEDELLGIENAITYPEAERHVAVDRMRQAKDGALLRYERMVRRKDGSTFPAEFSSRMLDSSAFQVIFHDITERRRAADALRESERRFSNMLENVELVSLMLDQQGRITYCNDYLLRLTDRPRDEVIGKDWFEIFIPPEALEAKTVFADLLADLPQSWHHENEILTRSGERRVIRWNNSVLLSASGEVIGTASIGEDVTESRRAREALATKRTVLRTLVDALPDVIFTKDASGHFTMANRAAYTNSGFASEAEMLGKTVFDLYPHGMAEPYHADDMRTFAGESVLNREEVGMHADGVRRWFLTIKVPLRDAAGKITGLVGVSRDITERKDHEEKIAGLNRIQAMLSGINSAIVRIRDRDELFSEACHIAAMHGAFKIAWIGMRDASGAVQPQAWAGERAEFFEPMMRDPHGAQLNLRGVATLAITEQRTIVDNNITANPSLDRIRTGAVERGCNSVIGLPLYAEGKVVGVLVMYAAEKDAFDDEEIKLLEELAGDVSFALTFIAQQEKVDYLAYYDTLTGLPNRSLFFDRLEQQLARASREKSGVGLVLIDLDRFRMVNDSLGRQAGDALLKSVADRIKASIRAQDTVARLGANTFAIALTGAWRAERLARFVETGNRELFNRPYWIGGEELRVSATVGVAVFPEDAKLPEMLVANAEAALRSAKQQNVPLLFYGREMNAQATESLRMENRLRRALERQELVLWYQPKIDVKTGTLTGFEALMRWNDPELGMIPPVKFIPLMEQTGLILEAGNWALSQVARDCAGWTEGAETPVRIAVNVSPLQLREKEFVTKVIDAVDGIEKSGGLLDLEITESVIMENVDAIIPKLQTLRGLGVRTYVDDFGTGYSSLAYIARLPIYSLKIDRSFVVGMTQNEDSLNIVNSVISLAHSLKLSVVAEGVETEEQAKLLKKLSCDEYQGYLFGRPVPASEVPGVMRKFG
jgi:diguanylate cyclase (GGDEF)-like protein/PAS domain S-box-containing protein